MTSPIPAISLSSLVALSAFVIGAATVSLMTWRNAQATGSVARLHHAAETTARK